MSKRSNLILISLLALAAGCSDVYEIEETMPAVPGNVERMLADFYGKLHPDTRSSKGFNIMDVATSEYTTADFSMSRAGEEDSGSAFNMHTVLLDFGETQGYAVLSDTPGIERIFYYTEEGCVADTALIPPLKDMIQDAPEIAADILAHPERAKWLAASLPTESMSIGPIVRFRWHQNWPFNFCATPCTCSECSTNDRKNHMLAGCVPIALAQTIATVGDFRGTFYGNKDIDFSSLPSVTFVSNVTPSIELTLGHFLQEIALNCQLKYGCHGSGTHMVPAALYLRDLGYLSDIIDGDLDVDRYIRYLKEGIPHIVAGSNSEKKGHAWILDGVIVGNGTINYHHNWGHGRLLSDGWSDGCYYEINYIINKAYGNDPQHLYIGHPR